MISAFDIYLVMQLDSIRSLLILVGGMTLAFSTIPFIFALAYGQGGDDKLLKVMIVAFLVLLFGSFVPSTRTAAALLVIPKIANNETIRVEAAELYELAKEALKQAATDAPLVTVVQRHQQEDSSKENK